MSKHDLDSTLRQKCNLISSNNDNHNGNHNDDDDDDDDDNNNNVIESTKYGYQSVFLPL